MRILSIYGARVITLALTSSFLGFAQQPAPNAVIGKLSGTWKENEAKRKLGGQGSLRFRRNGKGELEEVRGAEARPLIQPVRFGAAAYAIDGSKNTITWKMIDQSHFERQIFGSGKLIGTRKIQISADGKTLTEATERTLTDGKATVATITFMRTSGDPLGLVGVWKPQSIHSTSPARVTYEAAGAGLLKATTDLGATYTMALDGKPVVVTGPAVISGTMIAGKQVDANTLETTQSREGVPTGKTVTVVSADGKMATITSTSLGPDAGSAASVTVFDKQ